MCVCLQSVYSGLPPVAVPSNNTQPFVVKIKTSASNASNATKKKKNLLGKEYAYTARSRHVPTTHQHGSTKRASSDGRYQRGSDEPPSAVMGIAPNCKGY